MKNDIYKSLQPLSFRVAPELDSLPHQFEVLEIPDEWESSFRHLQSLLPKRSSEVQIPYVDLHKALRALVPGLISIDNKAWNKPEPWLYASTPINTEALFLVVQAWIRTKFPQSPARSTVLGRLRVEDLHWESKTVDLGEKKMALNGTASPLSPHAFHLLPDLLAAKLSAPGVTLEAGVEPLRFLRAPQPSSGVAIGSKGAELISWPPRMPVENDKISPFSFVITFTVQTVPFQEFPVVHCDISVRRWAYGRSVGLPPKEDTNVFVLTSVPWLSELEHSPAFQIAPMRWKRLPEEERVKGGSSYQAGWSGDLTALLEQLQSHGSRRFFDAEAIRTHPESFLNPHGAHDGGDSAAIVFRNGMSPRHEIGAGVPPADRQLLTMQIAELLQPEVVLIQPLQRAKGTRWKTPSNPFPTEPKPDTEKAALSGAERRTVIGQSFKGDLSFELWFQSPAERDALKKAVRTKLGMAKTDNFPFSPRPSICIHLREEMLGAVGDALDVPVGYSVSQDAMIQAIERRCNEVAARALPTSHPTMALVQIAASSTFEGKSDPYHALRAAFARTGRLTQFLATGNDDVELLDHRANSAVLDALRQLGLQLPLPQLPGRAMHSVGLWVLKKSSAKNSTRVGEYIPIMVRVDGPTGEVRAIAGMMEDWKPYNEVLLLVGSGTVRGVATSREVPPRIRHLVRRDLLTGEDVLFLCHAQNTRFMWSWLQNPLITPDQLVFGVDAPQPIEDWKGLRVVRVRESDGYETPESYPIGLSETTGFSQGLFRAGERVFMSLNPKPKQHQPDKRRSMLRQWEDNRGVSRAPSVGDYDRNSALCELVVACLQPNDQPEIWADLAHRLRGAATHHDGATSLPLPLHLAKQMDQYLLPMSEPEES